MYLLTSTIILATAIWSARMTTLNELYISQLIFGLASATNESIVEMTVWDTIDARNVMLTGDRLQTCTSSINVVRQMVFIWSWS